jgi:hypothetical protein
MLRSTIQDIKLQSYPDISHAINITTTDINSHQLTEKMFDDLVSENCKITITKNTNQHLNHITAIKLFDTSKFDIFVKIDDDDIYKKDYIQTIVNHFNNNPEVDMVSSKSIYQLNGNTIYKVNGNNLGGNPEGYDFNMPPTFAFNKKALDIILNINSFLGFEDNIWRHHWSESKIKIQEVDNKQNFIWHIHGMNISTASFLRNKIT